MADTPLSEMLTAGLQLAQTNGRLLAALAMTKHLIEAIGDVGEIEPKLGPELVAAVEQAQEIANTLVRAHNVAVIEFEIAVTKLSDSLEGDGHAEG